MNTFPFEANATKIWLDTDDMWIALSDGRQLSFPLVNFPRLLNGLRKKEINMS